MIIKDITKIIEKSAPQAYAESWDNVGLIVGDSEKKVNKAITTLNLTEEVLDEAIEKKAELIITHHPIIFNAIKKITTSNSVTNLIIKAIKHDVGIYAAHTNLDNVKDGLNYQVADKLGLQNCSILEPSKAPVYVLSYYVPVEYADKVSSAVFEAGGGSIGNYDSCGFSFEGLGTFKAKKGANPFIGEIDKLHKEKELKFEIIVLAHTLADVTKAFLESHPYETPAYNFIAINNDNYSGGSGVIGTFPQVLDEKDFLSRIKEVMKIPVLRLSKLTNKKISKVAICTGAGTFLIPQAIKKGADAFITADIKHHDFFLPDGKLLLIDAGHYETEQFSKEWFVNVIKNELPDFDITASEKDENPVVYWM